MKMGFLIYDLIFLFLFLIISSFFLYKRRKKLDREGLLILYRAKWGIKIINKIGKEYKKTLSVLSFFSIITGYLLMIGVIYLVYTIVKVYIFQPSLVRAIKVPPITPLIPYLPQVFKLEFLPPFYFTYWILIIAIIAISHEFAHGILAVNNKVKIKKTGFGFFPFFLPIFLAAFVELDEKKMEKKRKFSQLAILSAGTFANVIVGILFFLIFILFFSVAFTPSGIIFDTYATSSIPISEITSVNGIFLTNPFYENVYSLMKDDQLNEIKVGNSTYFATKEILESQKDKEILYLYNSAPAIKNNLSRIITEINGVKITSIEKLVVEMSKHSVGEEIVIKTLTDNGPKETKIVLEENPEKKGSAWLGIGFFGKENSGFFGKISQKISSFKKPNIYYKPEINGVSIFVYNFLWWIVLVSFSVALINMLPVGIFDGGRFFYLTILAFTKNEKIAKSAFKISTFLFLVIIIILMFFWVFGFFR